MSHGESLTQSSDRRVAVAPQLAAFAAGATLVQFCAALPSPLVVRAIAALATGALIVAAAAGARTRPCVRRAALAFALAPAGAALLGFAYASWRAEARLADALSPAWEDADVRIVGVVDDLPQNGESGARFAFAVEHVGTAGAHVPARISLAWFAGRDRPGEDAADPPRVHAGERWSLAVRLKRPHGNVNPHGFDLEAWLLERNLRATGYVREEAGNVRLAAFAGRFGDHVERARERIRERILAALPGARYAGVLVALAIGDQRAIAERDWAVFNRTGITHLVSISGLHVTVFATLAGAAVLALARRSTALTLRVPARRVGALAGALVATGYVLLAGAEVPAVRTLLMLAVAAAALWSGVRAGAMLVWLWALAVVLLWDPWAGLSPGFWLSFGAVGLLLYAACGRLPAPPARRLRERAIARLCDAVRAQWLVTIGLVPGTLALFQQVSLASALANAVAIPVVTLGIVPLALFAVVVPVDVPWRIAHAVLALLMRYLEALAALPLATWASHAPLAWTVGIAVAGIALLAAPRGMPGRLLGAAWLLPMALVVPPPLPQGAARIVVLDVGQGLAVVVATARHVLVYDTGPRYNDTVDAGARILVPYLRAAGIGRIDMLVVSHADTDHAGGALSLVRAVAVRVLASSLPRDHPIVLAQAAASVRCAAGMAWTWDGVQFAFVHPAAAAYDEPRRKSNDQSCVLRVATRGGAALLTGDVEAVAEREMLGRAADVAADVLVVPHHGSRTSSTSAFVAAVAPRIAVIAAGYRNRFGHPRADVLERYAQIGAALPRTDRQGAITVSLLPEVPIGVGAERERAARYWYDRE